MDTPTATLTLTSDLVVLADGRNARTYPVTLPAGDTVRVTVTNGRHWDVIWNGRHYAGAPTAVFTATG